MNCKPGEMAVIARTCGNPYVEPCLGWTFELTELVALEPGVGACWGYKGERRRHPVAGTWIDHLSDRILQPLRDPGDDAVDEMVLKLGKPKDNVTSPERETEDVS